MNISDVAMASGSVGGAQPADPTGRTGDSGQPPSAESEGTSRQVGRSQFFTFTLNLGLDEAEAKRRIEKHIEGIDLLFSDDKICFYSGGHELAPTTGQHHVQGYVELRKGLQWSFDTFKRSALFAGQPEDKSLWVTRSRGSALQNQSYTQKTADAGRWSLVKGEFRNYGQGKDPGLARAVKLLEEGVPLAKVYKQETDASARHYRFFKEYKLVTTAPRSWPMSVFYIYGPSGSGKSSLAADFWPPGPENFWLTVPKAGRNVWWDGYDNHKTVVIDDWKPGYFGEGHVLFMQRLVDRYALQVPVHGGQVQFTARVIVFTSNTPPSQMDSIEYSGYPWDATNPLYHRVFLREPPWFLLPIGVFISGIGGVSNNVSTDDPLLVTLRAQQKESADKVAADLREKARLVISEFISKCGDNLSGTIFSASRAPSDDSVL